MGHQDVVGFALANGTTKSVFEVLSQNPSRARHFGTPMKAFMKNRSVVHTALLLAKALPGLNFVVQDIPPVIEAAAKNVPSDLADRINFMAHTFLEEQPVKNAGAYFFRWIFYNRSDKYCIQILRNQISALKKGSRIIINDHVLPEFGILSIWREEWLRLMDLAMLELGLRGESNLLGLFFGSWRHFEKVILQVNILHVRWLSVGAICVASAATYQEVHWVSS